MLNKGEGRQRRKVAIPKNSNNIRQEVGVAHIGKQGWSERSLSLTWRRGKIGNEQGWWERMPTRITFLDGGPAGGRRRLGYGNRRKRSYTVSPSDGGFWSGAERKFARSVGFALRRIGSKGLLLFRLGSIARERFATNHAGRLRQAGRDRTWMTARRRGGLLRWDGFSPWFSKSGAACNAHGKKRVGKCGLARKLPPSNLPNWRVGGSFRKFFFVDLTGQNTVHAL